ncbi:MAG: Rrf2 family transcriptional regulator [Bacteroidales bacterium]|nr:Rrf2 family transcriptional regulator [Bacteroidales bacterium]MBK9358488.1 Rrf2 family transcriptional regulator [Bacteroidales bacterium]
MFSKACEYAIRATIYIARQSMEGLRASLADISREIDSPIAFTSKILQQLVKAEIIYSTRGQTGGFYIESAMMESITIAGIVTAIDGDAIYTDCGLGLKECSGAEPCPVHEKFAEIRESLKNVLESTNIASLASGLKNGVTCLKR